jgi:hypothetical protein
VLVSWREADGFPTVVSTRVAVAAADGIRLSSGHRLPPGGSRAGMLGHDYKARLVGLVSRQYTGWLEDGVYAPHTSSGFRAPGNKTLVLLGNGLMAKRGLRMARARRAPWGRLRAEVEAHHTPTRRRTAHPKELVAELSVAAPGGPSPADGGAVPSARPRSGAPCGAPCGSARPWWG